MFLCELIRIKPGFICKEAVQKSGYRMTQSQISVEASLRWMTLRTDLIQGEQSRVGASFSGTNFVLSRRQWRLVWDKSGVTSPSINWDVPEMRKRFGLLCFSSLILLLFHWFFWFDTLCYSLIQWSVRMKAGNLSKL